MKKIFILIPILILIFATTITKNSTKNLDKKIYIKQENLRILKEKYEMILLDYNYLSSPKKLMEYQSLYFENALIPKKIENLNKIILKKNEIYFEKFINKSNEQ